MPRATSTGFCLSEETMMLRRRMSSGATTVFDTAPATAPEKRWRVADARLALRSAASGGSGFTRIARGLRGWTELLPALASSDVRNSRGHRRSWPLGISLPVDARDAASVVVPCLLLVGGAMAAWNRPSTN
eukprot:528047-Pleurochrysis_carterae.AAC.1